MAIDERIFWLKEIDRENDLEFIILGYRGGTNSAFDLEAWIAPCQGSNLCRLSVGGHNIIDFDRALLKPDFTGTPVLYPTPNRVRNGVFRYQGKNYPQVLQGVTIFEHGLVHSQSWSFQTPEVRADSIHLKTWIDVDETSPVFQAFPFRHRLSLEYSLFATGLKVSYTIENKDDQALPFGFGLHPYFSRLCGDEGTYVELPAGSVMDTTSDLLPTGRLIEVAATIYDLRKKMKIGALDLDHVFTGVPEGKYAQVSYPCLGLRVQLVTTQDFSHLVLYSPRGASFFCLENQTCSTDAHNLFDRGFKTEAGLKFVPTGHLHTGSVTYQIEKG
jgi:aldose 1-epimerase